MAANESVYEDFKFPEENQAGQNDAEQNAPVEDDDIEERMIGR